MILLSVRCCYLHTWLIHLVSWCFPACKIELYTLQMKNIKELNEKKKKANRQPLVEKKINSKNIHLHIYLNTLHKKFQRNVIEAIRPAVLLCWAGAETTEGMEVIFKTEHLFKGDGRCNKPSRYLLHWFHAHWSWEMPSHSLCSLKCSCPPPHTHSPAVQGQAGLDLCEDNGLWGAWLQFLGKCLDLPWWQSLG